MNIKLITPLTMKQLNRKMLTEDTGKIFEMAICKTYGIEYKGKYKYGILEPTEISKSLSQLPSLFPYCEHTAQKGSQYDFTSIDLGEHLSAKSTKKGKGKVAPQVIGQATPQKFCEILKIPYNSKNELKQYIQENIVSILAILEKYTFDCPTVYYNKKENTIRYIKQTEPIDWSKFEYIWTKPYNEWKNSSTLKVKKGDKYVSILEIQFHTKRPNMAIRWSYEDVLDVFKNNFNIITLK